MKIRFVFTLAFLSIAPVGALAENQQEKQACMDDAFSVCGHAIPDRERVFLCLRQNVTKISAPCREVMTRYQPPTVTTAQSRQRTGPLDINPRTIR